MTGIKRVLVIAGIFVFLQAAQAQNWQNYAGSWSGTWTNQTYGTTGPFYVTITPKAETDSIHISAKTYGAFGIADTLRLETVATIDRDSGIVQMIAPPPFTGLVVLGGQQLSGQIAAPSYGITLGLAGTHSDSSMTIQYTMSGLFNAVGLIELQKELPTRVVADIGSVPQGFRLEANYPNPFNPVTTIEFSLANAGPVALTVHNLLGQPVRELVSAQLVAGVYRFTWDGRDDAGRPLPSGMYFYRLDHPDFSHTRRMILAQ